MRLPTPHPSSIDLIVYALASIQVGLGIFAIMSGFAILAGISIAGATWALLPIFDPHPTGGRKST